MNTLIRKETPNDHQQVSNVIKKAFEAEEMSDHKEYLLVERLRKSKAFIPELSIVAEFNGEIVGHILLSKINIVNDEDSFESLALAPVSVLPSFQNKGLGGLLIQEAHKVAKSLGYKSVVLLGHQDYYPKFGYRQASSFGIELPFDVPKENCMAIELVDDGLKGVNGTVEYPNEFF